MGFGGRKVGLVLLMTLSNALGPADFDNRCPRLNDSDGEGLGGGPIEFDDGIDLDAVVDESRASELAENIVRAESSGTCLGSSRA